MEEVALACWPSTLVQRGGARPPADTAPCARSMAPRGLRVPTIPARQQKGRVAPAWGGGTADWSVAGGARVRIRPHLCWQRTGAPGPSNERGLCLRASLSLLTSLYLTEFGRFFLLLPNIHVRACVECVFEEEGKKNHSQ